MAASWIVNKTLENRILTHFLESTFHFYYPTELYFIAYYSRELFSFSIYF